MNIPTQNAKVSVIGGDERQIFCAKLFSENGYEVALYGFEKYKGDIGKCTRCTNLDSALCKSHILILPLLSSTTSLTVPTPFSDKVISIEALFSLISPKSYVFVGKANSNILKISKAKAVQIFDYFEREELTVANAYLTAESAVSLAMNERNESLLSEKVLVLGYGRIGKSLCHILKALGADVFASARKKRDFAYIRAFGYSDVDTSKIEDVLSNVSIIFNTIPEKVLCEKELSMLKRDVLVIDLASKPGGVDFEEAKKKNIKVIWALGLPGKRMAKSAGKVIYDTIIGILEEEGEISV